MSLFFFFAYFVCFCFAVDPADSWLAFARASATAAPTPPRVEGKVEGKGPPFQGPGVKILKVSTKFVVPSFAANGSGQPAFWFGIETRPALQLVQPVLKLIDNKWFTFNEFWNWVTKNDTQSTAWPASPGDVIFSSITYIPTNNSYNMLIQNVNHPERLAVSSIPVGVNQTYTDAYFVVEHQPTQCDELPLNNDLIFSAIDIQWERTRAHPQPWHRTWLPVKFKSVCDCNVAILNQQTIKFVWNSSNTNL